MGIIERLSEETLWQDFLQYKIEHQHMSRREQQMWKEYISEQSYMDMVLHFQDTDWQPPYPDKHYINKTGTEKKRVVYSFPEDMNRVLKLIAFYLYTYDERFADNCYAFRRGTGVGDAMMRLKRIPNLDKKYCLKVDIQDYFNSIDVDILLEQLSFLITQDARLYELLAKLLRSDRCYENKGTERSLITEQRGAMAGTPVAPFLANVYLSAMDWLFMNSPSRTFDILGNTVEQGIDYFRYSDDILLLADSREELFRYKEMLFEQLARHKLCVNRKKLAVSMPGEPIQFLGFQYVHGQIDLSPVTKEKLKAKIRRKSHALQRWQRKKGLTGVHAAKGFIKAINHKLYNYGDGTDFCWSRWFFPVLTTDAGLKELDAYIQQYIRYTVTGRHYKGNYRITYQQMKLWGYRSLVAEYYRGKAGKRSAVHRESKF